MNFGLNENVPAPIRRDISKKTRCSLKSNDSIYMTYTLDNNNKNNAKDPINIISIDLIPQKSFRNIKIEYSKDKKLLDRLFEVKNCVSIKKKTFI